MRSREEVTDVIKAYDVRGIVGESITPELITDVGAAFGRLMRKEEAHTIAIGHDMRPSSPELARAFADGVLSQGMDVLFLGLTSTANSIFVSGDRDIPGAMFTASHNPRNITASKCVGLAPDPLDKKPASPISSPTWWKKSPPITAPR